MNYLFSFLTIFTILLLIIINNLNSDKDRIDKIERYYIYNDLNNYRFFKFNGNYYNLTIKKLYFVFLQSNFLSIDKFLSNCFFTNFIDDYFCQSKISKNWNDLSSKNKVYFINSFVK